MGGWAKLQETDCGFMPEAADFYVLLYGATYWYNQVFRTAHGFPCHFDFVTRTLWLYAIKCGGNAALLLM